VLVRADNPEAVTRARRALGRGADEEPVLAILDDEAVAGIPLLSDLRAGTRTGVFAPEVSADLRARYPGAVAADGRAVLQVVDPSDPGLHRLLTTLRSRHGCGAVALWPLAGGNTPVVDRPSEAIGVFRASRLDGLQLGPHGLAGPC
jgi:hypothetical protein